MPDVNLVARRTCCLLGISVLLTGAAGFTAGQDKETGQAAPAVNSGKEQLPAATVPQDEEKKPGLPKFMRQKLEASNQILEGLVTDNLSLVEAGCDALLKMSREEKWRISNDMLYRRYSREFIDAVADMKEKAAAQSIDGASLAWIKSTMTCLKCHEWVRNTVIADNPKAQLLLPETELAALKVKFANEKDVNADIRLTGSQE